MKSKIDYEKVLAFYKGKRVLVTGNTGFKGAWLTFLLLSAGAEVAGYALQPDKESSLFRLANIEEHPGLQQVYGDIRNFDPLLELCHDFQPEIVIHLAAQAIVRKSYKDPVGTYSTNVMGTVNICEAVRQTASVRSFLNVTTDKVYRNREWEYGYRENDELCGFDPYSNSKSCSELVTDSYRKSFLEGRCVAVSTARAGNVIGGGDFSLDRIIPDCVRAAVAGSAVQVRNPDSTRPYQHVLEPLFAYLLIAERQYEDSSMAGCYNVGPDEQDCVTTGDLVEKFCQAWNLLGDKKLSWENKAEKNAPHEANFLKLDCSKLKYTFGWQPHWHIDDAVRETVKWSLIWIDGGDAVALQSEMHRETSCFVRKTEWGEKCGFDC